MREKPDLPDPSGPLRETVPPTAIVKANMKVNEADLKKSKPGLWSQWNLLISDASAARSIISEVGTRAAEYGVTATIRPPLRDYKSTQIWH